MGLYVCIIFEDKSNILLTFKKLNEHEKFIIKIC